MTPFIKLLSKQYVGLCVFSLPIFLMMIEIMSTLSFYHHQIGSRNYYLMFRARSQNSGMRCMPLFILLPNGCSTSLLVLNNLDDLWFCHFIRTMPRVISWGISRHNNFGLRRVWLLQRGVTQPRKQSSWGQHGAHFGPMNLSIWEVYPGRVLSGTDNL